MINLPDFFEHYCPTKIVSGQRAVSNVPFEAGRLGCTRAFIITEKGPAQDNILKSVKQAFSDSRMQIGHIFDDAISQPHTGTAAKVADLFLKKGCDVFIALGSGYCMDIAKAANIILAAKGGNLSHISANKQAVPGNLYPMIAIPLAFTAGNQHTGFTVIHDEDSREKLFIAADSLYPNMAVIDPRAALNADQGVISAYALRNLALAIDAYFMQDSNPVVGIYARSAVELLRKYAPAKARITNKKDSDSALANAAMFAGIAFSHRANGLIAACAWAIEETCGLSAEKTLPALLLAGFDFYAGKNPEETIGLAGILAGSGAFLEHEGAVAAVSRKFSDLCQMITDGSGKQTGLAGLSAADLKQAAKAAATADNPFFKSGAFTAADAAAVMNAAL